MKLTIKKQQMRNAATALGFIVLSIGSLSAQIKVSGTGISDIISGKTYNPFINRDHANTSFWGYNVSGSLYADITPFKDLVFTSRFG